MLIYAIDDMPIHLKLYEAGHGAIGFTKPGALIDALCEKKPDLLICDLMMPKVDGWTIINIARELYSTLPIIVATSLNGFTQEQCAHVKSCYYWHKGDPGKLRELIGEIQQCIMHKSK